MERNDEVLELVYVAVDDVNSTLSPEQTLKKSVDTILIGGPGSLDSMGAVNFMAALEEGIERKFGATISLIDAITTGNTPVTIASVVKYVEEQIDRLQANGGAQASASRALSTSVE
jgi:acyl carrier protein